MAKIPEAITPAEAVLNTMSNIVIEECPTLNTKIRKAKENSTYQTWRFFMVNKCIKNSAVNNKLTHNEMGVTRSLQVTTKPVQDGMAESYFEVYCTVFKTAVEESIRNHQ